MSRKMLSPIEKAHWESRARSHVDVKDGVSACPLMGKNVQLIPVRYGRVERLHSRPDGDRYKGLQRPLGLRLVRDGFLYVIDENDVELHEYRLVDGRPAGLLWKGPRVTQDIRLEPGGSPDMVFPHDSLLHVAWSPIQWTAAKCMHMLGSSPDRYYFMQQVHLAKADCQKGGPHLRVESQIRQQLAEIAEQPAAHCFAPGIPEKEQQDYHWEDPPLFREAHIGQLKQALNPLYENDHLYLVLEDSLGIIEDLADEQDRVVDWISDWREAHDNELRYVTASYIDTLMTVGEHTARQHAGSDSTLFKKTTPDQRASIYAWVNARNRWRWEKRTNHRATTYRFDEIPQEPIETRMAEQDMALRRREMVESLGDARYNELKHEIEALEDSSQGTLNGIGLGARGIQDLVRHEDMQAYLHRERAHLKRWQQRLEAITEDRTHLLSSSEYHRSTWYFDPENAEQLEQALIVEQNCMRDLCRTDESLRKVGEFFHQNPFYILPVFQGRLDFNYLKSKAGDLNKWLDDIRNFGQGLVDANARVHEIDQIMSHHWSRSLGLTPQQQALHQGVLASFIPSVALSMDDWLAKLQSRLDDSDLHNHLKKLNSVTNRAQRLGMLVALQVEGVTLKVAHPADIDQFRDRLIHFGQLIDHEDKLKKQVGKLKRRVRQRGLSADEKLKFSHAKQAASQELLTTRHARTALRRLLEDSIEPTNTLDSGYIQARLNISDAQRAGLQEETRRLQAGMRGGYATSGAYGAAFKSSWAPLLLGALQVANIQTAWSMGLKEWENGQISNKTYLIITASVFSVLSSGLTAYQMAHIAMLDNVMRSVTLTTARMAGSLTPVKIGKLGLGLGGGILTLNFSLSLTTLLSNHEKWKTALISGTRGEQVGAFIGRTGDWGAVGTTALGSGIAIKEMAILFTQVLQAEPAQKKLVASQAWATRGGRFLNLAARLNLWGLASTLLQIGGEAIYNYYNLDEMQRWLSGCLWGVQPQGWSEADQRQTLAEATLLPTFFDNGIVSDFATGEAVRSIYLILPGLTPAMLDQDTLRWDVIWSSGSEKIDVSEFFKQKLSLKSASPLTLELKLDPDYMGHHVYLSLHLAVKPLLAEHFLNAENGYLYYHISLSLDIVNKPTRPTIAPPNSSKQLPKTCINRVLINDNH
ncbi:toxin VasX [Pseudomonas syringae]|nr:hypothetical protein [Pseudomonas syringae]